MVGTAHEAALVMYGTLLSGGGSKPSSPAGNQVRGWAVKWEETFVEPTVQQRGKCRRRKTTMRCFELGTRAPGDGLLPSHLHLSKTTRGMGGCCWVLPGCTRAAMGGPTPCR